ncbi:MAG: aminotransferase class IV [Rickettsiales bacterium]|nr:aminotransferase class IV [Rickettsiales bacterium]
MSRISYLNGEFLPHEKCFVHIEDRGFQFADGVYEVTLFKNGKLIDGEAHLDRLFRSLREIKIEHNLTKEALLEMQIKLFALNEMSEGICYINVTRGATNRIPTCPKGLAPTINATVALGKKLTSEEFEKGVSVMTHEDIRWKRCDIKTVGLLASTFMNQNAKDLGFDDVIFVRDGVVTEGSFANAFIVDAAGTLITKAADNLILCGITRNRLIGFAKEAGIKVEERDFNVAELMAAKEVFLTSSSLILRPVTKVDGKVVGEGKAGKIAQVLSETYKKFVG